MELTATYMGLLEGFQPVITAPSFATFRLLMTGWILSVQHRYVSDLIVSSDSTRNSHFSDFHRFFSHAAWDIDQFWGRRGLFYSINVSLEPREILSKFSRRWSIEVTHYDCKQHLGLETRPTPFP